jgi:hypothetical protein
VINFDGLPMNKPVNLPASGTYYATIETAEMKQPADPTKPQYLNICMSLKDQYGTSCGKIYDILSESEKDLVKYKLARFLIALNLTNLGNFELVDLIKVIKNKQLIVDVKQEEAKDGYPAKAVVDVFSGSIYYPMSEAGAIFGVVTPAPATPVTPAAPAGITVIPDGQPTLAINASDAADVHIAEDDDF